MSREMDALDLVIWYESQPDCSTWKSDSDIAIALGWFRGGQPVYASSNFSVAKQRARGGFGPDGDAGRVRVARQYVDKHNSASEVFAGYSYGTKRNGAGRRYSLLHTPNGTNAPEAVDESTSEQMLRVVQQANQAASEQARDIGNLKEKEQAYVAQGRVECAMCVRDFYRELEFFGKPTMTTLQTARRLGILTEIRGEGSAA